MASPQDSGHRGANVPGLGNQPSDRRITDLAEEIQQRDPSASNHEVLADPHSTLSINQQRLNRDNPLVFGTVIHAIPHLNWYRVQLGNGGSSVGCCLLAESSFIPVGVRSTSSIPPRSNVLVMIPSGMTWGIILGVIPSITVDGRVNVSDWMQQGGCSGLKREDAHKHPVKNTLQEGGVRNFSANRPFDSTAMEWGKFAETGVGLMIDPFQAYLRVNEACGIFCNYFDSYTRLAGMQFDLQTFARQIESREDEGELQYFEGNTIYPWEATGCYSHGATFTHDFPVDDVHFKIPKGKTDLADGEEDLQPIHRGMEYGGYLGQGIIRMMTRGAKDSGKRFFKDEDPDYGLWQEQVALDGSYTMRSAKSVYIGKRVLIPVPKRKRLREDQKEGDDARKDNYKFSSQFGSGDEHKVGDVKVLGEEQHMRRVAGVLDLLAYNYNWKNLHPFHYHTEDYKLHDEKDLQPFTQAQDTLNFSELRNKEFMSAPSPQKIRIDHRYGDVNYYQRESFMAFHEDGGVSIGCGFGAQIVMSAGQIRLEAPGDIMMLPGKRAVILGWDCIVKAKNSVDISASDKDVRIKAEKNMQLLAGNSGQGGLLLESKSTGKSQVYDNVYGERVNSSGIMMLAKKSEIALLGSDIYLRTGGGEVKDGNITLDASKGKRNIVYYGKNHHFFATSALSIWHSPGDENSQMSRSHRFARTASKIDGKLIVENDLVVYDGGLTVSKNVLAQKNVIAGESLAQKKGVFVGEHKGEIKIAPIISQAKSASQNFVSRGTETFILNLIERRYAASKLGNEQLLQQIGFSFRDPPGTSDQYKTDQFKMLETRWQQMVRTGMGSGGTAWKEKPVRYQGAETYPWPGKKKLTEDSTLLQYESHTIFDEEKAHSKDRATAYEEPQLGEWTEAILDGNYKFVMN